MSRPLRIVTTDDLSRIGRVIDDLKRMRQDIKLIGAKQTLKKLNSTIKSAEGAERHAIRAHGVRRK